MLGGRLMAKALRCLIKTRFAVPSRWRIDSGLRNEVADADLIFYCTTCIYRLSGYRRPQRDEMIERSALIGNKRIYSSMSHLSFARLLLEPKLYRGPNNGTHNDNNNDGADSDLSTDISYKGPPALRVSSS